MLRLISPADMIINQVIFLEKSTSMERSLLAVNTIISAIALRIFLASREMRGRSVIPLGLGKYEFIGMVSYLIYFLGAHILVCMNNKFDERKRTALFGQPG